MEHMPVFVRIQEPGDIHELVNILRATLRETKETLSRIKTLADEEESLINDWKHRFDTFNLKIDNLSQNLLQPDKI